MLPRAQRTADSRRKASDPGLYSPTTQGRHGDNQSRRRVGVAASDGRGGQSPTAVRHRAPQSDPRRGCRSDRRAARARTGTGTAGGGPGQRASAGAAAPGCGCADANCASPTPRPFTPTFFIQPTPAVFLPAFVPVPVPTPARPTPPSGTSAVTSPVEAPQREEEDEVAPESVSNEAVAYSAHEHEPPRHTCSGDRARGVRRSFHPQAAASPATGRRSRPRRSRACAPSARTTRVAAPVRDDGLTCSSQIRHDGTSWTEILQARPTAPVGRVGRRSRGVEPTSRNRAANPSDKIGV